MTIKEIASLAGVSASTVSKIINNKDENINSETRNRVLKIVKEYNYTPYASAIQASTSKTFLIGVLLRDSTPVSSMVQGMMEAAQRNSYRILLCSSAGSLEEEHKNIVALKKTRVDGIIWEPLCKESLIHQHYFSDSDIPVQYINTDLAEHSCYLDFTKLGYEATQVLIDRGHTKISYLAHPNPFSSGQILKGFRSCLYDNRLNFDNDFILPADPAALFSAVHMNQFTSVVSGSFLSALQFCEEFDKLQYRIPYDLSIISLQEDSYRSISFPKISCVNVPYYEFGCYISSKIIHMCERGESEFPPFELPVLLNHKISIDIPSSSRTPKIIVIGSINIDVMLNVDNLPQSGQTVGTTRSAVTPGGKGVNQAIAIAKLKHPVSLIGRVGNDYEGALIYEALNENHVDLRGLKRDINSETGKAYIHVQRDGESTISILSGANSMLSPNDIKGQSRLFQNASFCLLQTEVPVETVKEAARTAKAFGIPTMLKPAALKSIDRSLMENIDFFIPNLKEATLLCPRKGTVEEMADYFLSLGAKNVIITSGHKGCLLRNSESRFLIPAIPFTPVDTTGASDAFIASLAVYLSAEYPLEKAARIATYAASFCINRQGVVSALIDKNSLEIYIKNKEPELLN